MALVAAVLKLRPRGREIGVCMEKVALESAALAWADSLLSGRTGWSNELYGKMSDSDLHRCRHPATELHQSCSVDLLDYQGSFVEQHH